MSEFRDLFSERSELSIESNGQSWRIVYDPSRWHVRWHIRSTEETVPYADVIDMLARVIVEWDLTLDGEPLPCDEESLWAFPRKVIDQLYQRVFMAEMGLVDGEAIEVPEGKEKPSRSRSGTRRSKRPTTTK